MPHVAVHAERPVRQGHVAGVVPVGDVDVVCQAAASGPADRSGVAEMARQSGYDENPRLGDVDGPFLKLRSNRILASENVTSSVTATSRIADFNGRDAVGGR